MQNHADNCLLGTQGSHSVSWCSVPHQGTFQGSSCNHSTPEDMPLITPNLAHTSGHLCLLPHSAPTGKLSYAVGSVLCEYKSGASAHEFNSFPNFVLRPQWMRTELNSMVKFNLVCNRNCRERMKFVNWSIIVQFITHSFNKDIGFTVIMNREACSYSLVNAYL